MCHLPDQKNPNKTGAALRRNLSRGCGEGVAGNPGLVSVMNRALGLDPPVGWGLFGVQMRGSAFLTWENDRFEQRLSARIERHFL